MGEALPPPGQLGGRSEAYDTMAGFLRFHSLKTTAQATLCEDSVRSLVDVSSLLGKLVRIGGPVFCFGVEKYALRFQDSDPRTHLIASQPIHLISKCGKSIRHRFSVRHRHHQRRRVTCENARAATCIRATDCSQSNAQGSSSKAAYK